MTLTSFPRRAALLTLLAGIFASYFWTQSRYPALTEKQEMGNRIHLGEVLSFDSLYPVALDAPLATRVWKTTANWAWTNRKGMLFGTLFAGALVALMGTLRVRWRTKNRFVNAGLGAAVGAPLGVCVNCAVPIGRGLAQGGMALESALAAMHASPTLNFIVVGMLLALFPIQFAVVKLLATALFVLVLVPLIAKRFGTDLRPSFEQEHAAAAKAFGENDGQPNAKETWAGALPATVIAYLQGLWFIVRKTLPLMILTAFLAALVAELVPIGSLAEMGGHWYALPAAALLGALLPVPMSFDVVLAFLLWRSGFPPDMVMAFLFTLGIFSIYPLMVVWRQISRKVAIATLLTVIAVGTVSGAVLDIYLTRSTAETLSVAFAKLGTPGAVAVAAAPAAKSGVAAAEAPVATHGSGAPSTLVATPLGTRRAVPGLPFLRKEAREIGIDLGHDTAVNEYVEPLAYGRGMASGDYDGDGWPDLIYATRSGLRLFQNQKDGRFAAVPLDLAQLRGAEIVVVALQDVRGDTALDLVVTTFERGIFVCESRGGFHDEDCIVLPYDDAYVSVSLAFGDVNRDGRLDIYAGHWSQGSTMNGHTLHMNEGAAGFRATRIPGDEKGDTLSSLFSDVDGDGWIDLMVGNDFAAPDAFFRGSPEGLKIQKGARTFPLSSLHTMSYDTADIDGDLRLDVYSTDFPYGGERDDGFECDLIQHAGDKAACVRTTELETAVRRYSEAGCLADPEPARQNDCLATIVMNIGVGTKKPELCAKIPAGYPAQRLVCDSLSREVPAATRTEKTDAIPQKEANMLLVQREDGGFVVKGPELKVDKTSWSWSARFADLDEDGWQDLVVVNGIHGFMVGKTGSFPNYFFHNEGGKGFAKRQTEFGLGDLAQASALLYVDFDGDGDLDVFTNGFNGPPRVFVNNQALQRGVEVSVRDEIGNSRGVGTRLVAQIGGTRQLRELKTGGGYVSYDEPKAHFGLGAAPAIDRLLVQWSTGEKEELVGPFAAGQRLAIRRRRP